MFLLWVLLKSSGDCNFVDRSNVLVLMWIVVMVYLFAGRDLGSSFRS